MRWYIAALVVVSAACHGPSRHFSDVAVTRISVEGSTFDVRVKGQLAEAIRVNREYAPRFGPIRQRAGVAMRQASGCDVLDVLGDQSIATGVLDCGDRAGAEWLLRTAATLPAYECVAQNDWATEASAQSYIDYECYPR